MTIQAPILIVLLPLLAAILCGLTSWIRGSLSFFITLLGTAGAFVASIVTMFALRSNGGLIKYYLGGWTPPIGIEFVVDYFNAFVLLMVTFVCFLNSIFSWRVVREFPEGKKILFYSLALMLQVGLSGMVITGDLFNVYVFLEITALTSYALIAMGEGRAYIATLNYLLMGSIGACFFLLGIGYLYIKTGTLNMAGLSFILPQLQDSNAVTIGVVLCILGMWIKMGFFPLHAWLPNAYSYAPDYVSPLLAPLATKVSVYVMIRIIFSVFQPELVFSPAWSPVIVGVAAVGIVVASLFALTQRDLKKMLTYIIVAEVGYMVGGVWLGTTKGIIGSAYHIIGDGLMTACLFFAVAALGSRLGSHRFEDLEGIFTKMPLTMTGFVIGALSMIGIPPTAGFFSKWYLLQGGFEAGRLGFVAALLFSSLVNAVLFFRIFEIAIFGNHPAEGAHGHDHAHDHAPAVIADAHWTMVLPLLLVASMVIVMGLMSSSVVSRLFEAGLHF